MSSTSSPIKSKYKTPGSLADKIAAFEAKSADLEAGGGAKNESK